MGGNPKFLIAEKDGQEFEYQREYVPESEDILFEEGGPETVKDFLSFPIKDFIPRVINEDLEIPSGKILVLHEPEFEGNLILEGDLVIL